MSASSFQLQLLTIHWLEGTPPGIDHCAHGDVYVKIEEEEIRKECTVSATALYLLRSLKTGFKPTPISAQLLPCCGFTMWVNRDTGKVDIFGCDAGYNWTIELTTDGQVKHTTPKGHSSIISFAEYKQQVLAFVDAVEDFYKRSEPRVVATDPMDRKGYEAFWHEWHLLRAEWK